MASADKRPRTRRASGAASPLGVALAAFWLLGVAAAAALFALAIYRMDPFVVGGRPVNLGWPVQVFAASVTLLPALLAVLGAALLIRRQNVGRYLALAVNFGGLAVALFMLLGVWGVFGAFEAIVSGVMRGAPLLLGFALAYALYWLAGRLEGRAGEGLERVALMLAGLTLVSLLLLAGALEGANHVLLSYTRPQTWVLTLVTLGFAFMTWFMLRLGEAFGERPTGRNAWQGWLMLSPNILGFLFFFAGPLLLSLYLSFTDSSVGRVPTVTGLSNYANLLSLQIITLEPGATAQHALDFGYAVVREFSFGDSRVVIGARDRLFWISLFNTLLFCALLLPLAILPALGMALILNSSLPGVRFFRALYFLPSVAAVVGTALIWRWLYTPTIGYINYAISVVTGWLGVHDPEIQWLSDPRTVLIAMVLLAAWQVVGYNVVLFLAGLQGVPKALYEAARIDGAGPWQQFRNVTLPMIAPATFFVVITTMITGLQVFNEPYALFPSLPIPENATTLVYYIYTRGFNQFQFGYASSVAWILFIIIFGFTFVQFRMNRNAAYD